MSIPSLMAAFADLPAAQVGHGPQHPDEPAVELQDQIDEFLQTYPALLRDAGYVEFLHQYAGASFLDDDYYFFFDILGFSDASTTFDDLPGPVVGDNGLMLFAMVAYTFRDTSLGPEMVEFDFAMDTTGTRAAGIYRFDTVAGESVTGPHLVAADFTTWLTEVIERRGVLHDLG